MRVLNCSVVMHFVGKFAVSSALQRRLRLNSVGIVKNHKLTQQKKEKEFEIVRKKMKAPIVGVLSQQKDRYKLDLTFYFELTNYRRY